MGLFSFFGRQTPLEKVESLDDAVLALYALLSPQDCGFSTTIRTKLRASLENDGDQLSRLKAVLQAVPPAKKLPGSELMMVIKHLSAGAGLLDGPVQNEIQKLQPSARKKLMALVELMQQRAVEVEKVLPK